MKIEFEINLLLYKIIANGCRVCQGCFSIYNQHKLYCHKISACLPTQLQGEFHVLVGYLGSDINITEISQSQTLNCQIVRAFRIFQHYESLKIFAIVESEKELNIIYLLFLKCTIIKQNGDILKNVVFKLLHKTQEERGLYKSSVQ